MTNIQPLLFQRSANNCFSKKQAHKFVKHTLCCQTWGSKGGGGNLCLFVCEQRTQRSVSVSRPNSHYIGPSAIGPVASIRHSLRSISEISSCFFGPRPWHIEIRHRVKKTSTMNMFGFETLKLKFRRLKLWKPTVSERVGVEYIP